ncbi:YchJ family protein [Streptomyces sp. NPDC002018]|uniref:YchJ family protein n=1 Tax=Streptomyces sp. NPDC002018 TaxID=3364629 RepID=UPI00369A93E1
MARRPARSSRSARPAGFARPDALTGASPCPCGLPTAYGACCGRFHSGSATAPTAELLMRSRYSAFAVGDRPYLLRSWDPATRPADLDLDPTVRWSGLEILDTADGSPFHTTGTVTFRARFLQRGTPGALRERSRFARHDGAWVYVDGTFVE